MGDEAWGFQLLKQSQIAYLRNGNDHYFMEQSVACIGQLDIPLSPLPFFTITG
jgi:hypothetical protein